MTVQTFNVEHNGEIVAVRIGEDAGEMSKRFIEAWKRAEMGLAPLEPIRHLNFSSVEALVRAYVREVMDREDRQADMRFNRC